MIRCEICPHNCVLTENSTGLCGVRKEINGKSAPLNYGMATALNLDPIEKKPLYRFYPGSMILSYGSFGCNMKCSFCQNHDISMVRSSIGTKISPEELANKAISLKSYGNIGLAFTYNEPTLCPEFIADTGRLIRNAGMKNIVVTNGYMTEKTLDSILEVADAFNIDLKAFREDFYKNMGGGFEEVKNSIVIASKSAHVEVTTLIIPGENDSEEEIEDLSKWLSSVSPDIPLHLSRFFPSYKIQDRNPTPVSKLYKLKAVAEQHLRYVYPGNV